MTETMWAVRKTERAPGLTLEEVSVPVPGDDEALVEVETASICGTDLHIHVWNEWAQNRIEPPLTLGHEFAGTVVEVGRSVRHVQVGDYVSAESHVTCGMCFHCRTGQAHMCELTKILGVDRDGAFARYIAVPESVIWQNDREKLPPEIATLQEPFGNAVFATGEQDLAAHSIAVLGCGPVGLFTVAIASASGASLVAASDRTDFRLALARQLGADATLDASRRDDAVEWFRERNDGYGYDIVFEMSGAPQAIRDAFRIARNGGRVILFGIPARPVEIDIAESLIFKNLEVHALSGRRVFATWYRTRWLLEGGVVDLSPMITGHVGLGGIKEALARLEAGEAGKIIVHPGWEIGAAGPFPVTAADAERPTLPPRLEPWAHP